MNDINENFLHTVENMIAASSRLLSDGGCTREELAFLRLLLYEFQDNIRKDFRLNEIVKFRVSILNLDFSSPGTLSGFERFASFFISPGRLRASRTRKAIRAMVTNFREQLYSLRVLAFNYDLSCSIDKFTARYLTLAPM